MKQWFDPYTNGTITLRALTLVHIPQRTQTFPLTLIQIAFVGALSSLRPLAAAIEPLTGLELHGLDKRRVHRRQIAPLIRILSHIVQLKRSRFRVEDRLPIPEPYDHVHITARLGYA